MAGMIKISILADAAQAAASITRFRQTSEENVQRVVTTLGDSKLTGAFGRVQEGFDVADTRAMGFRDTITGVQDTMAGFRALTTSTADASKRARDAQIDYNTAVKQFGDKSPQAVAAATELANAQEALTQQQGSMADKLFLLGTGVGDLASGMANFIVPMVAMGVGLKGLAVGTKVAAAGQWLLNTAMLASPLTWVVIGVVALIAVLVVAWRRSETFRRIVTGAFNGVTRAARAAWSWVRSNWPLLLAVITGPIGLATRWVVTHFDSIVRKVKGIPAAIRGAFSGAQTLLASAGRNIVAGLWEGIRRMSGWIAGKVRSFIASSITGPIRNALKFGSPSRVARQWGQWTGQGLGLGLDDERSRVARSAAQLATATLAPPAGRASGGATGAAISLSIDSAGSRLDDLLVEVLRRAIRVQGGNVQAVLGRG